MRESRPERLRERPREGERLGIGIERRSAMEEDRSGGAVDDGREVAVGIGFSGGTRRAIELALLAMDSSRSIGTGWMISSSIVRSKED